MQVKSVSNDSGDGVQVDFEQDSVVSQANEYEVLQLLLADMRDRLTAYPGDRLCPCLRISLYTKSVQPCDKPFMASWCGYAAQ